MPRTIQELEGAIRALSPEDRKHLLRDLVADLDGEEDEGVEEAWLAEARRRQEELRKGAVAAVPEEEVFRRARGQFG